ncbi:hypothetical protein OGZ01_06170 [Vibrio harveyi]|nr:hypothetical protein [Vibrio harveyi]
MWLCSQLNLAKIEDRQARKEKWLPVTRSEIEEGELGYAVAWFKGKGVDSYQGRVEALREVFGEDKIPGLFAGMQGKHGTETTKAHNHLEAAAELVVQISDKETNLKSELSAVVDAFPELLRLRYQVLNHIRAVRDIHETSADLRLEQRIRLEDDSRSLYSRIEQAYQFAQFVQTAAQRIEVACDNVISNISDEPAAQAPFPSKLFTLSLGTISNILQGAIKQSQVTETQRIEYQGSTETLNFYLRTLQLDKVSSRLDDLPKRWVLISEVVAIEVLTILAVTSYRRIVACLRCSQTQRLILANWIISFLILSFSLVKCYLLIIQRLITLKKF